MGKFIDYSAGKLLQAPPKAPPTRNEPRKTTTDFDKHVPQLSYHPNFKLPIPEADETDVRYALRCAAMLISPPKINGEDEDTPCEVVASAVEQLAERVARSLRLHREQNNSIVVNSKATQGKTLSEEARKLLKNLPPRKADHHDTH